MPMRPASLVCLSAGDRTGYAEHLAQLAGFLSAETYRELLCTVDRNRHGVFWQQVEVVLRNVVTFHHVNSFQAVERCGELEAFEGLCGFERYLELLTGFHVAVFDVEDGRVGAALFGLHRSVRYCSVVNVTDLHTGEVFAQLVQHSVSNRNNLWECGLEWVVRVRERERLVHKAPRSVVRQFGVDAQDELTDLNDVERRDRTGLVGVRSDHFVWRVQRLEAEDVLGDQHQVIGGYTVERVVVLLRGDRERSVQRNVVHHLVDTVLVRKVEVRVWWGEGAGTVDVHHCFFHTVRHLRFQRTGHVDVVTWAVAEVVLYDNIGLAVVGVAGCVDRPKFNTLRAELGAGERHVRDRVAVAVNWEAGTCTALADGGLQLARWRAVVLRVLEEVGVPQRDHTGWHDVHGKTVQANNRWRLAILHREGVLVLSVVAATVRDEPLDLVRAVWQLRYHVGVLLCLGVPAYASSFVHTGYGLLDGEAPFLVVRYVALVELAWRAASEVRRVQVAVQHVVPAETGDANVHRVHNGFHDVVAVKVEEQQVLDVHVRTGAGVRARDAKVGWLLAQVVCLDTVVPPVHLVPELAVVWRQPVLVAAIRYGVGTRRCLAVDDLDDLLVLVAVRILVVERAEVRRSWVRWVDLHNRWCPWWQRAASRYRWAWAVARCIGDRERVRVWYVDARQVRVVRAPVDDGPGTFDLEASVRYHREHLIFVGYAQKFAVLAEEAWYTVYTGTVTNWLDGVVWELDEVVLFVGYHDTLGALARETMAVPCTERAGDRAAVTNRVKLGVAHRVRKTALALVHAGSVEAAVVQT
jgi:hypothetical protein